VSAILVQANQQILVGGAFDTLDGGGTNYLGRLNSDGSLDTSFFPLTNPPSGPVQALGAEATGDIVTLYRQSSSGYALEYYSAAGSAPSSLLYGSPIGSLLTPTFGEILFSRTNSSEGGYSLAGLVPSVVPPSDVLTVTATTISWATGGALPQFWGVTFESSANGTNWVLLGNGVFTNGRWQLGGQSLPSTTSVRARGFIAGGGGARGSSWFVENTTGRPVVNVTPMNLSNSAGTTAFFAAEVSGRYPLFFSWLRNGVAQAAPAVAGSGQILTLTLTNVSGTNTGAYSLVLSNLYGQVVWPVGTLTVVDPVLTPGATRSVVAGTTVSLVPGVVGSSPRTLQWTFNGASLAGATQSLLTLTNIQLTNAGTYGVRVSNAYGSATGVVAALTVLPPLNPWGANGTVSLVAPQPDRKLLVAGSFTTLGGQPCSNFGRLNRDGSMDTSFRGQGLPLALITQPDGRIIAGWTNGVWRMNSDGTLDPSFTPPILGIPGSAAATCFALQPDGKLVVGGSYIDTVNGVPCANLFRLNADGTLDAAFSHPDYIYSLALQSDGKILVGGFTNLSRLNPDGTLDAGFQPASTFWVFGVAVQGDGKIVVLAGGYGSNGDYIVRLSEDGSLDSGFTPLAWPGTSSNPTAIALQADGKVIWSDWASAELFRLNSDGRLDGTFQHGPDAANELSAFAMEADGAVVIGGSCGYLDGLVRRCIGRVASGELATQTLAFDGATITWLRGGSSPEAWRTTFETSTNGLDWSYLGAGTGVPGGWELTGLSLPPSSTIRARGYVAQPGGMTSIPRTLGTCVNGGGIVESIIGPPLLPAPPATPVYTAGTTATLDAAAEGTEPLTYQWLFNGTNLSGATNGLLVLPNVEPNAAGSYSVIVSNALGTATGVIANLAVVPPLLTTITPQLVISNTTLTICWQAGYGLNYQVQSATSLTSPNWSNVGSATTAFGPTQTVTQTLTSTAGLRFYRVVPLVGP